MKKVAAILLSLIILSGTCKELFTYANFQINKEFIISNFCVNLNKPETKCGGKCYLKKSIQDNHNEQESLPNQAQEKKSTLDLIPINKIAFVLPANLVFKPKKGDYTMTINPFSFLKDIFHPPQIG